MEMRAVAGKMPLFVTDMLRLAFLPCTTTSSAGSHVPEMSCPSYSDRQCNQGMCATPELGPTLLKIAETPVHLCTHAVQGKVKPASGATCTTKYGCLRILPRVSEGSAQPEGPCQLEAAPG